jgi:hypothetical protein
VIPLPRLGEGCEGLVEWSWKTKEAGYGKSAILQFGTADFPVERFRKVLSHMQQLLRRVCSQVRDPSVPSFG